MRKSFIPLAERRRYLVLQAAAQRAQLGAQLAQVSKPLQTRLNLLQQGVSILRLIRSRPTWLLGSSMLLTAMWPGKSWKLLRNGWMLWKLFKKLRSR